VSERFLVISTTGIGDTLMATPALRALRTRFPESEIDFVVYSTRRDLVRGNPHLDRIFPYRNNLFSRLFLYLQTRRRRYDFVLVLHANDDILNFLPRLRFGACYNRQGFQDSGRRIFALDPPAKHSIRKRMAMVEHIGGGHSQDYRYEFNLAEEDRKWAAGKLKEWGVGPEERLVGLQLGTAGAFRRWPVESFAEVARYLRARHRARIFVNASAEERGLVRRLSECLGDREFLCRPGAKLAQAAALIRSCALFITPDTGPMHMAIGLGVPLVALFVPPDPEETGPLDYPRAIVIQKERPCSPCLVRECPDNFCVRQITPDEVCAAADRLLSEGAPSGGPKR
jgi:ADP-heptose:LPS heptosyltransferase